ncbi:unnamed protein product [Protopolystoma xenopodis]|uniref:Insulinoma-associated protein 2 n=1 Tax=Protopolystoma xenopodis TaxID=117903 RepID=A0A3S5CQH9_9PLAT|nr:unnamed protein product [Protopolystoma xenopodis]
MDLRVIKKRIVELIPPPALALCSNPTIAPSTEITFCRHGLQHRLDQCPAYSPLTGVPDLAQFGLTGARTLAPGTRHLFPPLFQTTRLVPGPQIHDSFSLTLKPQSYASPYSFAHFTSAPDRLDCLARPKAVESSIKFPNLPTGLETCRSAVLKEDSPSSPRFSGQFCSPPLHHASVAPCAKRPRDCGARARTSASCRGSDPRRRHKQRRVGALARQNRSEARDTMEDSERFRSPINGVCILPPTWKGSLSSASRALSLAASPAPEMTLRAAGKSPSRLELASICTLSCTVNAANSSSSMPNESAAGFAPVVSSEALAALARIENKLGDYVCRLCEVWYPDAFQLAGHKCPRMALLAYPCAYCDKVSICKKKRTRLSLQLTDTWSMELWKSDTRSGCE